MGKVGEILVSAGIVTLIVGVGMAFNVPQSIGAFVGAKLPDAWKVGATPQYPEDKTPAKTA